MSYRKVDFNNVRVAIYNYTYSDKFGTSNDEVITDYDDVLAHLRNVDFMLMGQTPNDLRVKDTDNIAIIHADADLYAFLNTGMALKIVYRRNPITNGWEEVSESTLYKITNIELVDNQSYVLQLKLNKVDN